MSEGSRGYLKGRLSVAAAIALLCGCDAPIPPRPGADSEAPAQASVSAPAPSGEEIAAPAASEAVAISSGAPEQASPPTQAPEATSGPAPSYPWRRSRGGVLPEVWQENVILPQATGQEALFKAAAATPFTGGDFNGGPLVCFIKVTAGADAFGDVDIRAHLTIGAQPSIDYYGRDDQSTGYFMVSSVTIPKGSKVSVSVVDDDVFSSDYIGDATIPYDGALPLRFRGSGFDTECRALSKQPRAAAIASRAGALEAELRKLGGRAPRPDPRKANSGYWETSGVSEVWRHVDELAALVSFSDERVARAADKLREIDERWDKAAAKSVDTLARTLPPFGKPSRVSSMFVDLRVVSIQCDREAAKSFAEWEPALRHGLTKRVPCVIELEALWRLTDSWPAEGELSHARFTLVRTNGFDVEAVLLKDPAQRESFSAGPIKAGERTRYFLMPNDDVSIGDYPGPGAGSASKGAPVRLLRLNVGGTTVMLRLP